MALRTRKPGKRPERPLGKRRGGFVQRREIQLKCKDIGFAGEVLAQIGGQLSEHADRHRLLLGVVGSGKNESPAPSGVKKRDRRVGLCFHIHAEGAENLKKNALLKQQIHLGFPDQFAVSAAEQCSGE